MNLVFLDYETFWSQTHDIKKCGGPIRYVLHPDTEIQSCAVKINTEPTVVYFGDEIKRAFAEIDWKNAMAIGHNMAGFDAFIHAWRFGINPKAWGCTQALARPIYSKTCGTSLKAVAEALGVGHKLSLEATNTKGKRLADFTPEEIEAMREYNGVDTDLCAAIFHKLAKIAGMKELKTIDYTIRMATQPKFVTDIKLLQETLEKVDAEKIAVLNDIALRFDIDGCDDEDRQEQVKKLLGSAPKFAKILEDLGVEVPMKMSKKTKKMSPALAKTDQPLLDLLEHPDERVAAVVSARLDVKSTILQTRMQAFIDNTVGGRYLPMPLHYCGADTTGRWSGYIYNPQNMPRINPKKPKHSDALRNSLMAPPGYKIVVADQSGIELRVNHFLWKVQSSMDLYAKDALADLYKAFGAELYNIAVEEVNKDQRQLSKVAQLGLGYQAGAATFQRVAKIMGGVDLTFEESKRVVDSWRRTYFSIVEGWASCGASIPSIYMGREEAIDPWGFCTTFKNGIRLPSGRTILYPSLHQEVIQEVDNYGNEKSRKVWTYGSGRHRAFLSPGKVCENLVQAISRDIINDNVIEYLEQTGRMPSLLVHDEAVYVVKEDDAEQALADLQAIMRTSPKWWPEIVLWSEGDCGDRYGEAK